MTSEDAFKFLAQLAVVAELFDAKMSEAKQQIYYESLLDIELDRLMEGMRECARYCKFMPKPIEIREAAEGSHQDNAEDQWNQFREAIRSSSRVVGQIEWTKLHGDETPERYAVEAVFGDYWTARNCEYTSEMWQAKRKEFISAYIRDARLTVKLRHEDALALAAPKNMKLLK